MACNVSAQPCLLLCWRMSMAPEEKAGAAGRTNSGAGALAGDPFFSAAAAVRRGAGGGWVGWGPGRRLGGQNTDGDVLRVQAGHIVCMSGTAN